VGHWVGLIVPIVESCFRGGFGKVAADHVDIRNSQVAADQLTPRSALEVLEEEELLLAGENLWDIDGAAHVEAELVEDVFRDGRGRRSGVGLGIECRVLVIPPGAAVEVPGAALGGDFNGRAACLALLGIEGVGGEADIFNGVGGRDIGDEVGEPAVVVDRTVDAGGVAVVGGPVDIDRHGARRVGGGRVLFLNRCSAGNNGVEGLIAAALAGGEGKRADLLLVDLGIDFGGLCLQFRRGIGDGNLRGDRCRLEPGVDADLPVDFHLDVLLREAGKGGHLNGDGVCAWKHVEQLIVALRIGLGGADLTCALIGYGNGRIGNHCPG